MSYPGHERRLAPGRPARGNLCDRSPREGRMNSLLVIGFIGGLITGISLA